VETTLVTMKRRRFLFLATAILALNAFFWLAQGGFALPKAIINQFFGGNMVRAEVIVEQGGTTQDWRIDRGVITAISGTNVTLRERDNTSVTLQLDPNVRIQGPARFASVAQLRRRLRVVVYRQSTGPATMVQVEGSGG
jgi:hypothetical protein